MPMYCYECQACGHADDEFQLMKEPHLTRCPACEAETYKRVVAPIHTTHQEYLKPIHMHSIALAHPDDIAAFKRRNPDIQCSDDPRDPMCGVPVVKSRHQKMSVLRKEGFEEKN